VQFSSLVLWPLPHRHSAPPEGMFRAIGSQAGELLVGPARHL